MHQLLQGAPVRKENTGEMTEYTFLQVYLEFIDNLKKIKMKKIQEP